MIKKIALLLTITPLGFSLYSSELVTPYDLDTSRSAEEHYGDFLVYVEEGNHLQHESFRQALLQGSPEALRVHIERVQYKIEHFTTAPYRDSFTDLRRAIGFVTKMATFSMQANAASQLVQARQGHQELLSACRELEESALESYETLLEAIGGEGPNEFGTSPITIASKKSTIKKRLVLFKKAISNKKYYGIYEFKRDIDLKALHQEHTFPLVSAIDNLENPRLQHKFLRELFFLDYCAHLIDARQVDARQAPQEFYV